MGKMGKFYRHPGKESCFSMAKDYAQSQKIESRARGDLTTMLWDEPRQDVHGDWYLQKPEDLDCSLIVECYPGVIIVDGSEIDWPKPEEP